MDSEILLRLAERSSSAEGIDVETFIDYLGHCAGRLSIVTVASAKPSQVLLIKGNQPLFVRSNTRLRIYAYASEAQILDAAGCIGGCWKGIDIPAWSALSVTIDGRLELVKISRYSAAGG